MLKNQINHCFNTLKPCLKGPFKPTQKVLNSSKLNAQKNPRCFLIFGPVFCCFDVSHPNFSKLQRHLFPSPSPASFGAPRHSGAAAAGGAAAAAAGAAAAPEAQPPGAALQPDARDAHGAGGRWWNWWNRWGLTLHGAATQKPESFLLDCFYGCFLLWNLFFWLI